MASDYHDRHRLDPEFPEAPMILEATATDVEIDLNGSAMLFEDVAFCARIWPHLLPEGTTSFDVGMMTHKAVEPIGPFERFSVWRINDLVAESLTDRIYAGEWDDEIRTG